MIRLYNSLSRSIEDFEPLNSPAVGMYTCGPTVYQFAHIGNFRTYLLSDLLVRMLRHNHYVVTHVMNITDVGHLTGDNAGDADTGEDKMEKTAQAEGKSAWEVAKFYTEIFFEDYAKLHLTKPDRLAKATDHIQEQIALIKRLEELGYTYQTSDGIYFDTTKFPSYGKLSNLDQIREGARVEKNAEKKNPRDFALWKLSKPKIPPTPFTKGGGQEVTPTKGGGIDFSITHEEGSGSSPLYQRGVRGDFKSGGYPKRQMEWKSPWGVGFPGWHSECSAMSMKYLGDTLDIHVGGIDLQETHHPNEIAQSEAVTGEPFVRYWVHGAFILVNGEKMSKSKGNVYRLYDLEKQGYHSLALRYLYLQTHYRQEMNFTFPALDAAENALKNLYQLVANWQDAKDSSGKAPDASFAEYENRFFEAVNDDLNMPKALAVMWEMVKSENPDWAKAKSLFAMDEVLGFDFQKIGLQLKHDQGIIPNHIKKLVEERLMFRKQKRFSMADQIRAKIKKQGYDVEDTEKGVVVRKRI